jgi:hypothetical protein
MMNRSGIGRVQQQATRTPAPGTTRVSEATTPMATRAQFRAGDLLTSRGAAAPTHRRDREDDKDKDKAVQTDEQLDCDCECDETGDCDCDCDDKETLLAKK